MGDLLSLTGAWEEWALEDLLSLTAAWEELALGDLLSLTEAWETCCHLRRLWRPAVTYGGLGGVGLAAKARATAASSISRLRAENIVSVQRGPGASVKTL